MSQRKKTVLKDVFGIFLIATGIVGLALPILPGWLMIFVGIELCGIHLVVVERAKTYARSKYEEAKALNEKRRSK